MAVGEDISGDGHPIADGALDGEPSAIDLGLDILDDDSVGARGGHDAIFFSRHPRYRPPSIEFQAIGQRQAKCFKTRRREKTLIFGLFLKFITCHR